MSRFSRRSFLVSSTAIPLSAWLQSCNPGTPTDPPEPPDPPDTSGMARPNAFSPAGQAMLQKYATAVGQMKTAIAENSPTSWVFQWYTHAVRGDRTKAAELMRVFPTSSSARDLAQEMWDTCQAHHPGGVENYFVPWHRMYVFYFERIIRNVLGDPTFKLPYWNYSVAGANHGVVPPEFRQSGSPLLQANRNAGVNMGQPIDQSSPGALGLSSLSETSYSSTGAAQGFNMALDFGLHGSVHVLTGNSQNMGSVPYAAGDAVFWAHHCNIDRLWASWNRNGGQNPVNDASWMNHQFVFADENGNRIVGTIKDFLDIGALGYTYDSFEPAPPGFQPAAPAPQGLQLTQLPPAMASSGAAVSLGAGPTRVVLRGPQAGPPLEGRVRSAAENGRLRLVLRNLMATAQPGVLYGVYVNMPQNAAEADRDRFRAGYIHFFDAAGHADTATSSGKFFSFDVTELLRGQEAQPPAVTIIPHGGADTGAGPMVGDVALHEG